MMCSSFDQICFNNYHFKAFKRLNCLFNICSKNLCFDSAAFWGPPGRSSSGDEAAPPRERGLRETRDVETVNRPVIFLSPSPCCPWTKFGGLVMYERLMISDVTAKPSDSTALMPVKTFSFSVIAALDFRSDFLNPKQRAGIYVISLSCTALIYNSFICKEKNHQ